MTKPTTKLDLDGGDVHQPSATEQPPKGKRKRAKRGLKLQFQSAGGTFRVTHLADEDRGQYAPGVELDVACRESADKRVWIQLAKVGVFKGHSAGEFALTPKVFSEIVANFNATENHRVPIDFEHASEAEATDGSIPINGAPAQGWILEMDNRGRDGLWGLVEWFPVARDYIRSGQYKFFSPAIRFGARDRVTGKPIGARMTSGALTNNPFLDGMAPLQARDLPMGDGASVPYSWLCSSLGLHKLAAPAELAARCKTLRSLCEMGDGDAAEHMDPLRSGLGMAASSWAEVLDCVEEMIEAAIAEHEAREHNMTDAVRVDQPAAPSGAETHTMTNDEAGIKLRDAEARAASAELTVKAKDAELASLSAKVADLEAHAEKRDAADREREVDEAIAAYGTTKGVTASDKETLSVLLKSSPDAFRKLYPPVPAEKRHLLGRVTTPGGDKPANAAPATIANTSKPSLMLTARDLQKKNPAMSLDVAMSKAQRLIDAAAKG